MIAYGVITLGMTTAQPAVSNADVDSELLMKQFTSLKNLLNLFTFTLVMGVFQIFFGYNWAASLLVGSEVEKLWEPGVKAAAGITFAAASLYSLFLVAAFLPPALVLNGHIDRYNESQKEGRTSGPAISLTGWQLAIEALKLVGPILTAGPLVALFGK
jgi:hypothetical protein